MKSANGIIILDDASSFSPEITGVTYKDETGISIYVPMKLLVRLYETTKHVIEKKGIDWDSFCADLFK